jgi:hypothetical protein
MNADFFYILSLRHTSGNVVTWWRPENRGYTTDLNCAGRYTRQQVEDAPGYYDNADETLAVPCEAALAAAQAIMMVDNGRGTRDILLAAHDRAFAHRKVA